MKYLDEYRQVDDCRRLLDRIHSRATRCWTIMEVCGGQTHGLLRWGIDRELEGTVRLIHGPGCPVCVTPLESIDFAVELAGRPNVTLTSFGDMLRVPGSRNSLLSARSRGGDVQIVYSPLDAVQLAQENPDREVVFFAVGFETTAPATALAVQRAAALELTNFSLLVSHVRVLPAMELLVSRTGHSIDGFLAAGHVCTITGHIEYESFVDRYGLPVVVTGFEPLDLLAGIDACVATLERGEATVENLYSRSVSAEGNQQAMRIVDDVYEICDQAWRGIGIIDRGGLQLRQSWQRFDAAAKHHKSTLEVIEPPECRSGEVLTGRIQPTECECFGERCTPESPLGAPMVSDEGACAAYYRYATRVAGERQA